MDYKEYIVTHKKQIIIGAIILIILLALKNKGANPLNSVTGLFAGNTTAQSQPTLLNLTGSNNGNNSLPGVDPTQVASGSNPVSNGGSGGYVAGSGFGNTVAPPPTSISSVGTVTRPIPVPTTAPVTSNPTSGGINLTNTWSNGGGITVSNPTTPTDLISGSGSSLLYGGGFTATATR